MSDKESKNLLTRRQMILAGAAALAGATIGAKEILAKRPGVRRASSPVEPHQRCFYFNGGTSKEVLPVNKRTELSLSDSLIQLPGLYQYNEFVYDCSQEGLYRFINPGIDTSQRIVYENNIPSLLSSIAWITAHGTADESLSIENMTRRAKTSKLRLRCGYITTWAMSLLQSVGLRYGYDYRVARCLTGETPNGYDDGHVMIEVKVNGSWGLWDLDNNMIFKKDGVQLNLKELITLIPAPKAVAWKNTVNVAAQGAGLTKTSASNTWNAGASSVQTIASGDGYMEFTITETDTYRLCGLSSGDVSRSYREVNFGWYLQPRNLLGIYEFGQYKGDFGTNELDEPIRLFYDTGDRLRISIDGGVVKFWKNNVLVHTSKRVPIYPLLVDTALLTPGATLKDVFIFDPSLMANAYEMEPVADDGYSIEPFLKAGQADTTMLEESLLRTASLKRQWCNRIFQIPFIDGLDGNKYFYVPDYLTSRRSWAQSTMNGWEMSREVWESTLY